MNVETDPRCLILECAKRSAELHARVHETYDRKDSGPEARAEHLQACLDFRNQKDALAFPGGYEAGLEKIKAGDGVAISNALAFVEIRPYFFWSGYMRTKFIKLLKRAQLSKRQADVFERALEADREWRRLKLGTDPSVIDA